ncbi:MAG: hypothetical protein RL347_1885 [Actinomycetota bacterium]|jgi:hypothetical protein
MSDHERENSPRACAVIDIDGVLADVSHRLHHLQGPRSDWEAFFSGMSDDTVLESGVRAALDAAAAGLEIVYLTGRPERWRSDTIRWLDRHVLPSGRLVMRPDDDRRPARAYKVQALRTLSEQVTVAYLLDDDVAVVQAARAAGFEARLAEGIAGSHELAQAQESLGRT